MPLKALHQHGINNSQINTMKIKYQTPFTESLVLFENSYDMLAGAASDGGDYVGSEIDGGFFH